MTDPELRLVLQTALLGEVGPLLRAVGFRRAAERIDIRFYVDGPITDEDRESASCVVSEVLASLPAHVPVSEYVIRCDAPAPIHGDAWLVYRRRE